MNIQSHFNTICKSGNLEEAFINACEYGNLLVVQYLLSIKPDIDISAYNEAVFRHACCHGHLLVAQWLLTIKSDINISTNNEYAFRIACFSGHLLLAQWLQSLKPHLYVINYNNDGSYKDYYIRSKEEARWEQRKYLVWLASDQSPNKKSLFYRIPQDVSRYIISNYL